MLRYLYVSSYEFKMKSHTFHVTFLSSFSFEFQMNPEKVYMMRCIKLKKSSCIQLHQTFIRKNNSIMKQVLHFPSFMYALLHALWCIIQCCKNRIFPWTSGNSRECGGMVCCIILDMLLRDSPKTTSPAFGFCHCTFYLG